MPPISPTDWMQFLEKRMDNTTAWMQLAIAAAGLVPLGSLLQVSALLSTHPAFLAILAAVVVSAVAVLLGFAASLIRRRRRLLLVMTLVLTGALKTNTAIARAYLHLV